MNNAYKEILDNFFGMILENSINDNMMEFSYKFPYDGMKEYVLEICDIPFSVFLEYINKYQDNDNISADCVSQFSKLDDCLLGFCKATDNVRRPLTFEEIGERLQDDGVDRSSVANTKYGENHSKMAMQFGLAQCRYNYWYISALGKVFSQLPKAKQDALMIRTLLRNKLYASIFTRLQDMDVSIDVLLRKANLSESTRARRLSSIKTVLVWYFSALAKENFKYTYRVLELPILLQGAENAPINYTRRKHIIVPNGSRKEKYLYLLSAIPLLDGEEEKELVRECVKGNKEALDALVEAYLPVIKNLASKYSRICPSIDIQDLIGEGIVALYKSLKTYNAHYGTRVLQYAIGGVRQAIFAYVVKNQTIIQLPFSVNIQTYWIKRVNALFLQKYGREPSVEELAEELDLPIDKIHELCKIPNSFVSIDAPYEEGKNYSLSDVLVDDDILSADGWLINESLSIEVDRALQALAPREAYILRKFFGIGTQEKTLEEIGNELQLTHERVRQIKEKAIRKLSYGQRSYILMTYLGGILPTSSELSFYAEQKELDKQEHLVLQNAITSADTLVNKQVDIQKDTPINEKWIVELETKMGCLSQWLRKNNRTSVDEIIQSWSDIKFLYTYFEQQGSLELTNKIKLEYDRLCYDIKLMRHRCELLKRLYTNGDDYEVMAKELNLTLRELYIYLEKTKLITTQKCNVLLEWQYIIQYRTVIDVQTLDKLYIYKSYFQHIKRSYRNGENAPHKIILLLAILTLYKNPDQQKTILIEMSDDLVFLFNQYWGRYVKSNTWKRDISMPWSHMSNEPFWHEGSDGSNVCYIDADLRDLLKDEQYRQILREVLREQLK